jgi:hypothetical protein
MQYPAGYPRGGTPRGTCRIFRGTRRVPVHKGYPEYPWGFWSRSRGPVTGGGLREGVCGHASPRDVAQAVPRCGAATPQCIDTARLTKVYASGLKLGTRMPESLVSESLSRSRSCALFAHDLVDDDRFCRWSPSHIMGLTIVSVISVIGCSGQRLRGRAPMTCACAVGPMLTCACAVGLIRSILICACAVGPP